MDSPRWKPLTGTPSKPPLPANLLVPDPSPARSTNSDTDSLTMLPPSPQGSFIHRRRQGQYVPRPPVWNISKLNQETKNSGFGGLEAVLPGDAARAGWFDSQLPGMSVDDQVRRMADVFYDRPLVVNMMTGQEPHGDPSRTSGDAKERESEAIHSRSERQQDERGLKVPGEEHFDSANPSMSTTAVGSKHSSELPEGHVTTGSKEDRRPNLRQVQQLLADVQNALQRHDRLLSDCQNPPSSRDNNAPFQSEQLANAQNELQRQHRLLMDLDNPSSSATSSDEDGAPFQSEQRAPTHAAGPTTSLPSPSHESASSTYRSTDGGVPVRYEQKATSYTPRRVPGTEPFPKYLDSGTVRSGHRTTPLSPRRREDMNFAERAAYDASHLARATRLPRILQNTDEINDAGLDGIPYGPVELSEANDPPKEGQATKKSKRKTVLGFFQRPIGFASSFSNSATQIGPRQNRAQGSGDDAAQAAGTSATEVTRRVLVEDPANENKTVHSRFKEWRSTFGRSSKGYQMISSYPRMKKKPSVKLKGILKNRDYRQEWSGSGQSDDERVDQNIQVEKHVFRKPVRLSDPENPLLGGITQSDNDYGTMRASNERSTEEQGVSVSPNPFQTPFDDEQHITSADMVSNYSWVTSERVTSNYSWVTPEPVPSVAADDDATSSHLASADHPTGTTPRLAETVPAANVVDEKDDILTRATRQGPLADITNQGNPREYAAAGPSNSRPAVARTEPTVTYVTNTPRMRPLNDVPADEELILPPPASQTATPMLRPNELREEIKALNPLNKDLDSR